MTINGRPSVTLETFDVVNPSTNEVFAHAPSCSPEQLDAAMESSARAFLSWSVDESARQSAMHEAADEVVANEEGLGLILTREQGMPIAQATREAHNVAAALRYYADLETSREVVLDDETGYAEIMRRPSGPAVAITPWNFPLMIAASKLAPALRAGATVVLKPSPFTPLATLRLGEVLRGALPPGVFNVVSGPDPLGALMCEHRIPRNISFTGSIATGKKVAEVAGRDLKRMTLELGGNDPAILLDDVDPEEVADQLFFRGFYNSGQTCIGIKRVYAPVNLYGRVVEALAERARRVNVGDGMAEETELGPLNNETQLNRVNDLVADAIAHGGKAVAGGHRIDIPGFFFEPTILAELSDGVRIVDEEQFGPAMPVIAYSELDDAVARANATHFGLGGSVWSRDEERAWDVATRLECGTAWVNTHAILPPSIPFGGVKWSGLGVQSGRWGVHSFSDIEVIYKSKPRR